MKRVVAWVLFGLAIFGIVKAAQAFKNPWAMPSPASVVLDKLPQAHEGCKDSKDCFHD